MEAGSSSFGTIFQGRCLLNFGGVASRQPFFDLGETDVVLREMVAASGLPSGGQWFRLPFENAQKGIAY